MAGRGEQPAGGRRPNMDKESEQQGPESLDDHSAAPHEENPEYFPKKVQVQKKTFFTEVQLNALEAQYKKKLYVTPTERELLANRLSLPQLTIRKWFQNRRAKARHQALNSKPESKYHPNTGSKALTQDQLDLQHMQNKDGTISCEQTQKQSLLGRLPPLQPMDSYVVPQEPHSSQMVYCQNVGGRPESCSGTEVCKMPPESGHTHSNTCLLNLSLPNKTTEPETSIWTPESSITTDLTFYDELSLSSAPSTPQMPIAWDDERSSTDPYLLTGDEATDSD